MIQLGTFITPHFPVALAPMEDITDPPFRRLCKKFGADILVTEFVAADGLIRDIEKSLKKLQFGQFERPLGIQIFGNNPEVMARAAQIAETAHPDFIDLNFGCPVRKIAMKGGGAGLLQNIPLLLKITEQVIKSVKIPVSAKTRLGWDENSKIITSLAEQLQDAGIQMLTIHGRTRSQMYKGISDWTLIGEVKNNPRIKIPIIGNGDIDSPEKAKEFFDKYGVDGIMIGRASIGKPWLFKQIKDFLINGVYQPNPSVAEICTLVKHHLEEEIQWKGQQTAVYEMRQHLGNYFKGLPDFKPYRIQLLTASNPDEIKQIIENISIRYS